MKRVLLILVLVFAVMFSARTFAEVKQGDVLIGATSQLIFSETKIEPEGLSDEKVKITSFDISAQRLVTDNFSIGGLVDYEKEDYDTGDTTATILLVYGTAYLQPQEKINPYISIGIGRIDVDFDGIDGDGFGYGGNLGILYFLNNNIALDLSFLYITGDLDVEGTDVDYTSSGFGAGFMIKF